MYVDNDYFIYRFQRNLICGIIPSLGASLQDSHEKVIVKSRLIFI
jgi:hypothetical protein